MSSLPKCSACGEPLTETSCEATFWERSPYGDEFSDELHQCTRCNAWLLLAYVDRFSGPDELRIEGPLTDQEVQEQKERMSS